MKILVTGGAGFIGSHLADRLVELGHEVRIFDSLDPQVHGGGAPDFLNPDAEFIRADVRDRDALARALDGVEAVFHYAAAVGVAQSQYQIRHYLDVNVTGTATLLDILANHKGLRVERLVVPGSMTSYGEGKYRCPACGPVRPPVRESFRPGSSRVWDPPCPRCGGALTEPLPMAEEDALAATSFYGMTKRNQEEMSCLFHKIFRLPVTVFRYFNVYGPRQSLSNPYTGVMAIFLSRIKNGSRPEVYEDGLQSRDFIYIDDVVEANVRALESKRTGGDVFNIGTGIAYSIADVARRVLGLCGSHETPSIRREFRKGDVRHCYPDMERARRDLGFVARVPLDEGMKRWMAWASGQTASDLFDRADRELRDKGIMGRGA